MDQAAIPGLEPLVEGLSQATRRSGDVAEVTSRVKSLLQELDDDLEIPESYVQPLADRYARRLLHRCSEGTYSVIAMTWGPGQGTPLHDHSGLWCVECVHEGAIDVVQFDLLERRSADDPTAVHYRFSPQETVRATRGSAGALIPPFEYHTIANASSVDRAVTLHVYGGDLTECAIFEPAGDGLYVRVLRQLSCDN